MNWTRQELFKHGGCIGCSKPDRCNAQIATKEVAMRTKRVTFPCNNLDSWMTRLILQTVKRLREKAKVKL